MTFRERGRHRAQHGIHNELLLEKEETQFDRLPLQFVFYFAVW